MAKKLLLSAAVILIFIAYTFQQRSQSTKAVAPTTTPNPTTDNNSAANNNSAAPSTNATYKDGNYVGDSADAFYGNIQVEAVIQNGKITDIKFLQYPNDRENSIAINSQAMPVLKQEAIRSQSANVDGVSGATDSSQAFVQSLQSALDQAKQS